MVSDRVRGLRLRNERVYVGGAGLGADPRAERRTCVKRKE